MAELSNESQPSIQPISANNSQEKQSDSNISSNPKLGSSVGSSRSHQDLTSSWGESKYKEYSKSFRSDSRDNLNRPRKLDSVSTDNLSRSRRSESTSQLLAKARIGNRKSSESLLDGVKNSDPLVVKSQESLRSDEDLRKETRICVVCQAGIASDGVMFHGKTYHRAHFSCCIETCRKPLYGALAYERDEMILCERCFHKRYSPECAYCKEPIKDVLLIHLECH